MVKFRFDDVGIVFQTAYALLLPAYTFAKANHINLAELTNTVVKLSHQNVRGCLDTAYNTGQDGNAFICRASELRPRSRKQKADPHVANLGLVAAFAGMARAQKKPKPSSSRASTGSTRTGGASADNRSDSEMSDDFADDVISGGTSAGTHSSGEDDPLEPDPLRPDPPMPPP